LKFLKHKNIIIKTYSTGGLNMKRILSILGISLLISGCTDFKEGFNQGYNEKEELNTYMIHNDEAVAEYNKFVLSYHNIKDIEEIDFLTQKLETETLPLLNKAIVISQKENYKTGVYNELKEERTIAFSTAKKGIEQLIVLNKKKDFTPEEKDKVFVILKEAFEQAKNYEERLLETGEKFNEKIILR
jgi:hypothetical protein